MNRNQTHLQVGAVTRPHGIRGELKVHLHNEESTTLESVPTVVLELPSGKATRHEIETVRGSAKKLILRLVDVSSRESAEALRGAKVWVERTALDPLEPGEYFLVDLVGSDLQFEGETVGSVTSVRADPSVDTLVVQLLDGSTVELAMVPVWVGKVDTEAHTVELLSKDGLIS